MSIATLFFYRAKLIFGRGFTPTQYSVLHLQAQASNAGYHFYFNNFLLLIFRSYLVVVSKQIWIVFSLLVRTFIEMNWPVIWIVRFIFVLFAFQQIIITMGPFVYLVLRIIRVKWLTYIWFIFMSLSWIVSKIFSLRILFYFIGSINMFTCLRRTFS